MIASCSPRTSDVGLPTCPAFDPVHESRQLGQLIWSRQDFYIGRIKIAAAVATLEQAMGLPQASAS